MGKSTDITVKNVAVSTEQFNYRTPIKFGGRVVNDVTLLDVKVKVEDRSGGLATGSGSMPLGNIWAWPSSKVNEIQSLAVMQDFADAISELILASKAVGHPIEIAEALSVSFDSIAKKLKKNLSLAEEIPKLAQLVSFSPFDAAIHDAYGRLLNRNSYDGLGKEFMNRDLSTYLSHEFEGEYLDQYTSRQPKPALPLYHLVGALDPVLPEEVHQRVDDGLPETLAEWIVADGLTHLKIKLSGEDLAWDVLRVLNVDAVAYDAQHQRRCKHWYYSVDFNEKCENVDYVIAFLNKIKESSSGAFERIQYIEQPTHRDLRANPENKMFAAAKLKPVVIDESLIDYESLLLARAQGYSGVALKSCKGQSEALLMGAAAQKFKMFLCVQDLTCIGASFLHSASLAARVPTVSAIEGNGRQYCPDGNERWKARFPGMFKITDGTVKTAELTGPGLYDAG